MPRQGLAGLADLLKKLVAIHATGFFVVAAAGFAASPVMAGEPSAKTAEKRKVAKTAQASKRKVHKRRAYVRKPSDAKLAGLHKVRDRLRLRSSVALVIDQDTQEVLLSKNEEAVLPIASLSKLMTGIVVRESELPMDEKITITRDDVDTEKGSKSRLHVGAVLTRAELLHLALMSSENRAAHALGRSHPGGMPVFVALMNKKAEELGMNDTKFVEPTGLSSDNKSSATDLAMLVDAASEDEVLREYSTSPGYRVAFGRRRLQYSNTNWLVRSPKWDIGLQKTGYISEAGQCLVLQAKVAGRKLIMVFLDSVGRRTRLADAERVRRWVESQPARKTETSAAGTPELHALQTPVLASH